MAEPRRLQFTTVQTSSTTNKATELPATTRLKLSLTKPDRDSCTEYSYTDLVRSYHTKENESEVNGSDVVSDEQEVREVARALELKYGTSKKLKKVSRDRIQDLVDLGDGYDETDTFIDNSEAYDEIVPDTLTTKYGGFYINSGVLDFREITDSESCDVSIAGSSKKRIRRLMSDSDSDNDFIQKNGRKKKVKDVLEKSRKRLMKKQNRDKDKFHKPKLSKKKKVRSSTISELLKQQPASASTSDVSAAPNPPPDTQPVGLQISTPARNDSNSEMENKTETMSPQAGPALPDGLPDKLKTFISEIKQAAKQSREGKCKFFTDDVNKKLLAIHSELVTMRHAERSVVYAHLASYLPCSKDTLIKRAKRLRVAEHDCHVRQLTHRLAQAVSSDMASQAKNSHSDTPKQNVCRTDATTPGGKLEGEGQAIGDNVVTSHGTFTWTDETRDLLCDVIRTHMMRSDFKKLRSETHEEYLMSFLETQILPLWPLGRMQINILYQESTAAHASYTSLPKKNPVGRPPSILLNNHNTLNETQSVTTEKCSSDTNNPYQQIVNNMSFNTTTKASKKLVSVAESRPASHPATAETSILQKMVKEVPSSSGSVTKLSNKKVIVSNTKAVAQPSMSHSETAVSQKNVYDVVKMAVRKDSNSMHVSSPKQGVEEKTSPKTMMDSNTMTMEIWKSLNQQAKKNAACLNKKRASESFVSGVAKKDPKIGRKSDSTLGDTKNLSDSYFAQYQKFSALASMASPIGIYNVDSDKSQGQLTAAHVNLGITTTSVVEVPKQVAFIHPYKSQHDAVTTVTQSRRVVNKKHLKVPKTARDSVVELYPHPDSTTHENALKELEILDKLCAAQSTPSHSHDVSIKGVSRQEPKNVINVPIITQVAKSVSTSNISSYAPSVSPMSNFSMRLPMSSSSPPKLVACHKPRNVISHHSSTLSSSPVDYAIAQNRKIGTDPAKVSPSLLDQPLHTPLGIPIQVPAQRRQSLPLSWDQYHNAQVSSGTSSVGRSLLATSLVQSYPAALTNQTSGIHAAIGSLQGSRSSLSSAQMAHTGSASTASNLSPSGQKASAIMPRTPPPAHSQPPTSPSQAFKMPK